ncbi:LysR substrate-binding domain-containing protein [Pseudomonas gessardii]|uniref:LysR substrate-binding domain-containing protein n=1 Tax=Pseudomonas gessardii TaxID=78544 RepID=UPI0014753606|nr:LysR family transcriptional regulator [Pseudomonas gessardii]NNA91691.1 LysR family transcriptional regulator [Pseudomonas gessardii]
MVKHTEPDQTLIKMPSLRAVKAFVAAARYQNFTRAAEALCVTQAAISRQIRELEDHLGAELFNRAGRAVELTSAGSIFYDAVQLSFTNIAQAAERISSNTNSKHVVTLCCSQAFANLLLLPRLPSFFEAHPEIDLNLVVTQNFLTMENGVHPDLIICKLIKSHDGYHSQPLMHDQIYPVCSPLYLEQHPELRTVHDLRDGALLNLSPFGRSQVAEHVDWSVWLAYHDIDLKARPADSPPFFNANDYNLLIQLALNHQGVVLGWNHLVGHLVKTGVLVRPVEQMMVLQDSKHYLSFNEDKQHDAGCRRLHEWLLGEFGDDFGQGLD